MLRLLLPLLKFRLLFCSGFYSFILSDDVHCPLLSVEQPYKPGLERLVLAPPSLSAYADGCSGVVAGVDACVSHYSR